MVVVVVLRGRGTVTFHIGCSPPTSHTAEDMFSDFVACISAQNRALLHLVVEVDVPCPYLDILHDNIYVVGRLDDLIQPDYVRVHEQPQNLYFPPDCKDTGASGTI